MCLHSYHFNSFHWLNPTVEVIFLRNTTKIFFFSILWKIQVLFLLEFVNYVNILYNSKFTILIHPLIKLPISLLEKNKYIKKKSSVGHYTSHIPIGITEFYPKLISSEWQWKGSQFHLLTFKFNKLIYPYKLRH